MKELQDLDLIIEDHRQYNQGDELPRCIDICRQKLAKMCSDHLAVMGPSYVEQDRLYEAYMIRRQLARGESISAEDLLTISARQSTEDCPSEVRQAEKLVHAIGDRTVAEWVNDTELD